MNTDDAIMQQFGQAVREARMRLKLSQTEVADYVGFTRSSTANVEAGLGVSFGAAMRMARLLKVDLNALRDTVNVERVCISKRNLRKEAEIARLKQRIRELKRT